MTRFFLLALFFGLVWRSLGRLATSLPGSPAAPRGAEPTTPVESLIACGCCGVYHPASRMLGRGGDLFCSEACRRGESAEAP